jgi:hypothetical protein
MLTIFASYSWEIASNIGFYLGLGRGAVGLRGSRECAGLCNDEPFISQRMQR